MDLPYKYLKSRKGLVVSLALALGLFSGWAIASAAVGHDNARPRIGTVPDDVDGDGLVSDSGAERYPSLIGAVGDHGVVGYIRLKDFLGEAPSSPEEALAQAEETRVIPIYDADGVTQVDTLTETDGGAVVDGEDTP